MGASSRQLALQGTAVGRPRYARGTLSAGAWLAPSDAVGGADNQAGVPLMHLGVSTLLPGKRHPRRSAVLIRCRTTMRRRGFWTAAVLMSALAVATGRIVLGVVTGTLRPPPLLGRFLPLVDGASADAGPVDTVPRH
jgi:hypothetical protein